MVVLVFTQLVLLLLLLSVVPSQAHLRVPLVIVLDLVVKRVQVINVRQGIFVQPSQRVQHKYLAQQATIVRLGQVQLLL